MENFVEIIKAGIEIIRSDWPKFLIFLILPVIGGIIVTVASLIGGWKTLETNFYNKELKSINLLLTKARNGSKADFVQWEIDYDNFVDSVKDGDADLINEKIREIRSLWADDIRDISKNNFRYVNSETGKTKKWSLEQLYNVILPSSGGRFDNDTKIAVLNEIAINKHEYFVEYLYEIATTNNDIFVSMRAARAIAMITNFEPYKREANPKSIETRFLHDIPEFKTLTRWWDEVGSKNEKYKCPFSNIITDNRNYFAYDYSHGSKDGNSVRLQQIQEILSEYPLLARTKAEAGYLSLEDKETYASVRKYAQDSLDISDTEPLPYLLLAYISFEEGNNKDFDKWIDLAIEKTNLEDITTSFSINEKFMGNLDFIEVIFKKID